MMHKETVRAALAGSVVALALLTVLRMNVGEFRELDHLVSDRIIGLRSNFLTSFFVAITEIFNTYFMTVAVAGASLVLILEKRLRLALILAGSLALGGIASAAIKLAFRDARPQGIIEIGGWSYPSGHATIAMIAFLSVAYIYRHIARNRHVEFLFYLLCAAMVLMVGVSRMYLGVHWLSDVLGGFLLGLACFSTVLLVTSRLAASKKRTIRH